MSFFSRNRSSQPEHEFAVVGLGRFGTSLARTLVQGGKTVLGIDSNPALVQRHSHEITQTACLDASDEEALREIDIASYSTVVVAIGDSFEGSLMCTVALKSVGVKTVIAKALTLVQRDILLRVGADRVVLPEHQAGQLLAEEMINPLLVGQINLGEHWRVSQVKPKASHLGHTLEQIRLKDSCGLDVLALVRGKLLAIQPSQDTELMPGDHLLVAGSERDLDRYSDEP